MSDSPTDRLTDRTGQPSTDTTSSHPHRRSILAATAAAVATVGCLSSPFGGPGGGDADEDDQDDSGETSSTEPPDEGETGDDAEDAVDEERNDEPAVEEDEEQEDEGEEEDQNDESLPTLTAYEDHAYGYEIQHPESWELVQDDEQLVMFDDPDGVGELAITIYLAEGDPSLKDGADIVVETIENEMTDVNVRDWEQTTLDSGEDAIDLEIDYTHPERGGLRSRHRLVAVDHILYAAALAVPLDEWEQREDLAEAVITSLAITDAPSESATDDVLANRETYEGEGFSIEYPTEWTVDERDNGDIHFQTDKARAGMVVAGEPSRNQPLDEFVEAYRDEIKLNPDAEIVDQRDDLKVVNGNDAHLLITDIDDGETTARTFGLTTVGDGTVYYVTLEFPKAAHTTAAEKEIIHILTSLSF